MIQALSATINTSSDAHGKRGYVAEITRFFATRYAHSTQKAEICRRILIAELLEAVLSWDSRKSREPESEFQRTKLPTKQVFPAALQSRANFEQSFDANQHLATFDFLYRAVVNASEFGEFFLRDAATVTGATQIRADVSCA